MALILFTTKFSQCISWKKHINNRLFTRQDAENQKNKQSKTKHFPEGIFDISVATIEVEDIEENKNKKEFIFTRSDIITTTSTPSVRWNHDLEFNT